MQRDAEKYGTVSVCYSVCGPIAANAARHNAQQESEMAEASKQQQAQIKADEKELLGQYSNLVVVHHNAEEFTLNFIYMFPTVAQGKLVASMILNPRHAKRLMRALQENIARYEAQFGALPDPPGPDADPKVGFVQ
jgi:hypothetical protein